MVINSLNLKWSQILPIFLDCQAMYPLPPIRIGKVDVRQRPLVEGGSTIISVAFIFGPIYLRLEGNVPPFLHWKSCELDKIGCSQSF